MMFVPQGGIAIKHTPAQGKLVPEHNQIRIVFPNGYTVSIVYGGSVYSSDRNGDRFLDNIKPDEIATTVEVAILDPQGEFVKFRDGETVKGFSPIHEVLSILNWVSTR